MLPLYTRWLSVEDYGTTDIINVYTLLLMGLVTACITDAVFIFPKGQKRERQKSYFSSGMAFAILALTITAVLFKVAYIIFTYNGSSNTFTENLWSVYGLLAATFLQSYVQQFVRSIDKLKVYSITGIIASSCTALYSFFFIPGWGVVGFVAAMMLAYLSATVYSFFASGAYKYLAIKSVAKAPCLEMLRYSIPLIPNDIMWWLVSAFNRPLLESYLGMHSVGIYAVASKLPGILGMMFAIFTTSWQISVLEEYGKEGYTDFFNKTFRMLMLGLMVLFFGITICSKLIISIFATEQFFDAWRYVPVLTLGVVFSCIGGFAGSNFAATRESKYYFYSSVWGAIAAIAVNFLLIPYLGMMGAAISSLLSYVVISVSRIAYGWKYVKIQHLVRQFLMVTLGILLIFVSLNIEANPLKYFLMTALFLLLVPVNYDLRKDIMLAYSKIYARIK
jgi:O-antigen/teichoic acid export membrane protein